MLTGGGTGGHVYPALAVAAALHRTSTGERPVDLLFVGTNTRGEAELVRRDGLDFQPVRAGALRVAAPWSLAKGLVNLTVGTFQALRAVGRFQPDVVFATGGYASVPVALAARLRRRPLVVYLPDLVPGWAVRLLARLARRVAVTAGPAVAHLPSGKAIVTGYPVRRGFFEAQKEEGRRRLGLDPERPALFVSGGSQGGRSLNQAVAGHLPRLLEICQVVHVSGRADHPWLARVRERLPEARRAAYHLHDYLHDDMPWAMAAADLAVMRAGASTLGELTAVGLPAILVPYPYAGGHQRANARYLEDLGGAVIREEEDLPHLLERVRELLDDRPRLESMAAALRGAARFEAAEEIARLVLEAAACPSPAEGGHTAARPGGSASSAGGGFASSQGGGRQD
jgi:UDP-N-acetylglucosamine--N-acetylmuramyl-(pentapeptide) pyrophosphoryl-undecaprenol N-acetylglucosamine transferase